MSNLTILNTSVRSLDNLYSLTDLHRLSGGEEKHRPSHFLRLDQTKDLISAIESENSNVQICTFKIIRGGQGGTYACEELALAYATWISSKFHLVVLRAFIAMHRGENLQISQKTHPLAEPEPTYYIELDKKTIHDLVWLAFSHEQMRLLLGSLIKPLEAIGSRYSGAVYGNYTEYQRHYRDCLPLLKNLVAQLKQHPPLEWERLANRLN